MSLYKGTTLVAGRLPTSVGTMTYKGKCLQSALPTTAQAKGDFYILTDTSGEYKGKLAVWNGNDWDYSNSSGGSVEVDNTTIVLDSNNKLHATINAYESSSAQTMIIGVKNVTRIDNNVYSFESNTAGEVSKIDLGETIKGKLNFNSEEYEFEETSEQIYVEEETSGEILKIPGITMIKEFQAGVDIFLGYDVNIDKFILCATSGDLSTYTAGFNLNASLLTHTIHKVDSKFIGYDNETIKVNDSGDLYAVSSGVETDNTSIVKNGEDKLAVSYGGKYVESLASLVVGITVGEQIATNIYKVASEGVPELEDFAEGETLKGDVEMTEGSLNFEGVASSISIPKGDPSAGEMFDFTGVVIVEYVPGLDVNAYFGRYIDDVTGEKTYIVALYEGDASLIINDIHLNVNKASIDYDHIKPQVIPTDETIEINGSNQLKVRFEANPELEGSETELTGIEWKGTKYKIGGNDYLSKSGGTMTGAIALATGENKGINAENDKDQININGGTEYANGAFMSLYGKESPGNPGGISMTANNGTNTNTLILKPDGTFTVNGKGFAPKEVFNKTALDFSPLNGFTGYLNEQLRIEHENYYEYRLSVTVSGGTRSETAQTQVGIISNFWGKNFYTHQPVACWVEGGSSSINGLIYGSSTDANLGLYISGTTTTQDIRMYINIIRYK